MSNVLVTGCSSGFGLHTAVKFAREGYCVYATVRDQDAAVELFKKIDQEALNIKVVELDVRDRLAVEKRVKELLQECETIDVLINNAGIAGPGALEDSSHEQIEDIMKTNFYGPLWLSRAVLPVMRAQKRGHIIMVSSLSALVGLPSESLYCASKAALEAASESMRYEVERFGIKVAVIEPGLFKTRIMNKIASQKSTPAESPYSELVGYLTERAQSRTDEGDDPQRVADLLYAISQDQNPRFRYAAGEQAEKITQTLARLDADEREVFIRGVHDTEWWSRNEPRPFN